MQMARRGGRVLIECLLLQQIVQDSQKLFVLIKLWELRC